jgi:hypothetical protein
MAIYNFGLLTFHKVRPWNKHLCDGNIQFWFIKNLRKVRAMDPMLINIILETTRANVVVLIQNAAKNCRNCEIFFRNYSLNKFILIVFIGRIIIY